MKKPVFFVVALAAAIFAGGYIVGQSHSGGPSSAAAATQSLAVGKFALNGHGGKWVHRFDGQRAFGRVTAVTGNVVMIKPFIGPRGLELAPTTIKLTSSTKYYSGRETSATSSAVKVGRFIAARGTLSADKKTLTADTVMVLPTAPLRMAFGPHPGFGRFGGFARFGGPAATGKVTAVTGATIAIKPLARLWGRPTTVTSIVVTNSTQYMALSSAKAGRASIKIGSYVRVQGTLSKDGKTLTASRITIMPSAPGYQGMWARHAKNGPASSFFN